MFQQTHNETWTEIIRILDWDLKGHPNKGQEISTWGCKHKSSLKKHLADIDQINASTINNVTIPLQTPQK